MPTYHIGIIPLRTDIENKKDDFLEVMKTHYPDATLERIANKFFIKIEANQNHEATMVSAIKDIAYDPGLMQYGIYGGSYKALE